MLTQSKTSAEARKMLDSFTADPRNRYANHELQMLIGAEQLAGAKRFVDALMIAELAALRSSQSGDAHLILASVAESAGRRDLAKAAIERTLEIHPNSRAARALPERLSEQP